MSKEELSGDGGLRDAVPFHMRPSAQPFVPTRQRPCPHGQSTEMDLQARHDLSSASEQVDVLEGDMTEYARLPSVGTWLIRRSGHATCSVGLESLTSEKVSVELQSSWLEAPDTVQVTFGSQALDFSLLPSVGTWLHRLPCALSKESAVQVLQDKSAVEPIVGPVASTVKQVEPYVVDLTPVKAQTAHSAAIVSPAQARHVEAAAVDLKPEKAQTADSAPALSPTKASAVPQQFAKEPNFVATTISVEEFQDPDVVLPRKQAEKTHLVTPERGRSMHSTPSPKLVLPVQATSASRERDYDHLRPPSGDSRTPLLGMEEIPLQFPSVQLPTIQSRPARTSFRRQLMPPTERRRVGTRRLRARDQWNVEELRANDIMSNATENTEGIEEMELEKLIVELYGEEQDAEQLTWTFKQATRGKPTCLSFSELHYALRGHHVCNSPSHRGLMRTLATTDVGPVGSVDPKALQRFLEELNDGYTVSAAEVNSVLDEAAALFSAYGQQGEGKRGRAALIRAIAGWYLHVDREDSPWSIQFVACYGRWIPEKGYHTHIFGRFIQAKKATWDSLQRQEPESKKKALGSILYTVGLLIALVFPTVFFLWLVILGAQHGDDRCPRDLDGLITWFGVLGLASLTVGCADTAAEHVGSPVLMQRDRVSQVGVALKAVLLLMPWIGACWTFHLSQEQISICGSFLTDASALLWTSLLIAEVLLGLAFLWLLAVFAEHEMAMRASDTLSTADEAGLFPSRSLRRQQTADDVPNSR
eukprot:TRINITY_DN21504_c0_g1_i1.p1 TRINITY_DN21504_c0_g1~~TRINITY_DN21504_c0_g1_i1.p1  ORF type:complete len:780 (+),score=132.71 TRINITY_DN21504_c0_g1_i1:65-2341(+)